MVSQWSSSNYVSRYLSSPKISLFATVEPVVLFFPSEGSCIESYIFMGIPDTPNPHLSKDYPEVSVSPRFEWKMSDTFILRIWNNWVENVIILFLHRNPTILSLLPPLPTCGSKKGVSLTLKNSVLIPMLPWVVAGLSGVKLTPQSKPILGHKRKPLLCASQTKATMSAQFSKKVSKCHPNSSNQYQIPRT